MDDPVDPGDHALDLRHVGDVGLVDFLAVRAGASGTRSDSRSTG